MQELRELQRQGMSIQAISELTGWDRKTIRKYMQAAGVVPEYGPRSVQPSKLDAFKPYLEERLRAGVWNARVLAKFVNLLATGKMRSPTTRKRSQRRIRH